MKLTRIKPGEYQAENGLKVKRRGDVWFVITQDYQIVHRCKTLKSAREAVKYYTEKGETP